MFDDDVRQLLEAQGPWNIRVDKTLGKIYIDNGTNFLEFEPQVEEYMGYAHGIEWNVQRYKKLTI
jgi:hypothetical protein